MSELQVGDRVQTGTLFIQQKFKLHIIKIILILIHFVIFWHNNALKGFLLIAIIKMFENILK